MKDLAPQIFRKRLLIEGFFTTEVSDKTLIDFFKFITQNLNLRTYGEPIIHATGGQGKEENQGYDAFVPLIDSGIYIAVWSGYKFLSMIIYTCAEFDEQIALIKTQLFFEMTAIEHSLF
ncbi:hypothetical protein NF867_01025 [Solitalea sp. MAHUQ-68]|uniref:Uncharacterized protein n=1 Tax=Solitalea agri TaxID=2953739 RepID=A0A9X2JAY6_9SPHI|nr:hypothetical protein [Solitalea agri]MCO4291443.1 hypothetical protein [Solitalea agri]